MVGFRNTCNFIFPSIDLEFNSSQINILNFFPCLPKPLYLEYLFYLYEAAPLLFFSLGASYYSSSEDMAMTQRHNGTQSDSRTEPSDDDTGDKVPKRTQSLKAPKKTIKTEVKWPAGVWILYV